ncbi:uncharacterized protein LOC105632711 [Jatropha curcas]|uniref:uncharacterized protein LOC105632711 n=1 Tax=Jatropha curcas TaxID=180498 RepID=UPI0005FC32B4|nr:uncharacterized protein LOC105632711 [Jatropha curcas]
MASKQSFSINHGMWWVWKLPGVLDFLGGGELSDGICNILVTFLPKVDSPEHLSQFHPISLSNVLFKLITKVNANRIKLVLIEIISPTESSFILGRQIYDNVIVLQEVVHSMQHRSTGAGWMF